MISEKTVEDAKFYGKLLAIFVTTESCNICDELFNKIQKLPISRKYYFYKVDGIEHTEYMIRLTRGYVPTITVISPSLKVLGIIESIDIKFIEDTLRKLVDSYYKGYEGQKIPEFIPEPKEPNKAELVYDTLTRIISGYPADFRMIELFKFITKLDPKYKKLENSLNFLNQEAKYLIDGKIENMNLPKYANLISFYVEHELVKVDELLSLITENGEVYRSAKRENKGLLIDQASAGNALLSEYEKTLDSKYLNLAEKVYEYTVKNLNHEKGFRDSPIRDEITKVTFLEPLANAEASIFFSRFYAITENKDALNNARKAINSAYAGSNDPKVLARIAIALVKIEDLILTNIKPPYEDLRLEYSPKVSCKYYKDGNCIEKIEEIKFLDF